MNSLRRVIYKMERPVQIMKPLALAMEPAFKESSKSIWCPGLVVYHHGFLKRLKQEIFVQMGQVSMTYKSGLSYQ